MTGPTRGGEDEPASRVLVFNDVESTNTTALKVAQDGDPGGLWVLAETQSAGRGRAGRAWQSETGNLYASYLTTAVIEPAVAAQASLVAGVAAAEAVHKLAVASGHESAVDALRLKWPNDVLIDAAKLGGILVETATLPGSKRPKAIAIVVGFGLNVTNPPALADRLTVSLQEIGLAVTPSDLLRELDAALRKNLTIWNAGENFAAIRTAWMAAGGPIGERIVQSLNGQKTAGRYQGLDDNGALLMADETGSVHTITVGDIDFPR